MTACRWCGSHHGPRCPIVKALEFSDDQLLGPPTVRRVEFFSMEEMYHHEQEDLTTELLLATELTRLRAALRKISSLPITPEIEEVLKPFAFRPPPNRDTSRGGGSG